MKKRLFLSSLYALTLGTLTLSAQETSSAFSDLVANGDGTSTNWLGTISRVGGGAIESDIWVDHTEHGRLYVQTCGQDVWLYDPNVDALGDAFTGYIYTSRDLFPFFFVLADTPSPLFLNFLAGVEGPRTTPRVFVNQLDNTPLLLPKSDARGIVGVAVAAGFNSLAAALTRAELIDALSAPGPFTVFAPTDEAFNAIDPVALESLLTDDAQLKALTDILLYHVVPGRISASDLGLDAMDAFSGEATTLFATTLGGRDLRIDVTPFGVMINGAMVSTADIETSNGTIHVIDEVLFPQGHLATVATNAGFDTLVAAVGAADPAVISALTGPNPLTVFAPTNAAFAALGDTLNTLLLPESQGTLTDILLYHVVPGKVYSSEVAPGEVGAANGGTLTFTADPDGTLRVNGIRIIATDVIADNGVVHVIEEVLVPPSS